MTGRLTEKLFKLETAETDLQIASATLADCTDIALINRETFVATYTGVAPDITEDALRYHTDGDWLSNKTAFYESCLREGARGSIGRVGEKAVGFAIAGTEFGLYVLPECQGSSAGIRLLDDLAPVIFDDLNLEKIVFTVVLGTSAVRFYERLGCRPTGNNVAGTSPVLRGGQVLPSIEMELTIDAARHARERIATLLARHQAVEASNNSESTLST